MKFGKIHDIENIDFTLPSDDEGTKAFFEKIKKSEKKPKVFVGCTGWSMKEWVGHVYPKGTKQKDYLREYVKQFNTIELNTTHYRIPTTQLITQWRGTALKDFHFCPKVPQSISHSANLGANTDYITLFCNSIYGLKENLGCSFMQLPPYFAPNRLPILARFLEKFPKEIPLAIEVRHEDWFNNHLAFNNLCDLLESHHISTVITDVAGRRDVLHQRITTTTAMIRFVGNDLHTTDYERIDEWVERHSRQAKDK